MRVLLLTDSLSLPRSDEDQKVNYEDTYIAMLRSKFPDVLFVDSSIGGATIKDLYKQVFYYRSFSPDLVFIQCGIVDCAPRDFRPFEKKLLVKLGLIKRLKKVKRFLRKYRGYKLTSSKKFNNYLTQIRDSFKDQEVYSIGILSAQSDYEKLVPGISKSIKKYNEILENRTNFIDTSGISKDEIMKDFHHLNKAGHEIIYKNLAQIISSRINEI